MAVLTPTLSAPALPQRQPQDGRDRDAARPANAETMILARSLWDGEVAKPIPWGDGGWSTPPVWT